MLESFQRQLRDRERERERERRRATLHFQDPTTTSDAAAKRQNSPKAGRSRSVDALSRAASHRIGSQARLGLVARPPANVVSAKQLEDYDTPEMQDIDVGGY